MEQPYCTTCFLPNVVNVELPTGGAWKLITFSTGSDGICLLSSEILSEILGNESEKLCICSTSSKISFLE